jgi:PAS domain S-box-containing protein
MPISTEIFVLALLAAAAAGYVAATLLCRARQRSTRALASAPGQTQSIHKELSAPKDLPERPDFHAVTPYLDAIAAGVVVSDPAGNLIHWNRAARQLHGFDPQDALQGPLIDFTKVFVLRRSTREIVPFEQWPMSRLLRGEEFNEYELHVDRVDTDRHWTIAYSGSVIPAVGGGSQMVLTLQDLTGLRQAERELRQSHIDQQQLIESLPQLVWTCRGEDGSCDYLSPQFVAYTGVPAEKQLGFGWTMQLHPDDRERVAAEWKQVIAQGDSFDSEYRLRSAAGEYRWFRTLAVPFRDSTGRITRWFGTNTDVHERKMAAESQARLAAIVEHSNDAIISKALDGTITSWNRAAEKMFGFRAEDAIGRHISLIIPPERREEEEEILRKVTSGVTVESFDSQRLTKTGEMINVASTISPIRDSQGRVVGASRIVRDITQRQRDAAALRESERRFRELAESLPQIVWNTDANGVTRYRNRRWQEFSGLSTDTPIAVDQVVHPDDVRSIRAAWAKGMAAGVGFEMEFRMKHVAGSEYHWFLARAVPVRDASGRITEWFGTSTDIDALKRAEWTLQHSEQHLRATLDSLLVFVAVLKLDGTIEGMNRAALTALASRGIHFRTVEGRSIGELSQQCCSPQVHALLVRSLEQAARGEDVHLNAVCITDGPPRVVLDLMLAPMRQGNELPAELILSAVDVTTRELAAQQARERQAQLAHMDRVRSMGQMAAGLAHELNQPLGAVANYARACRLMLGSNRLAPERLNQALDQIESQAMRAGLIINRLRGFVKKQSTHAAAVDPNELVKNAVKLMAYDLRQVQVEPRLSLAADLPKVLADTVQIEQVLVNLMRNAVESMQDIPPARRSLEIQTALGGEGRVQISVHDRGCGIAPGEIERVFDAFFTTKPNGLGVGLALCRTIIQDHGGELTAEARPGGGTTFTFSLRNAENHHDQDMDAPQDEMEDAPIAEEAAE